MNDKKDLVERAPQTRALSSATMSAATLLSVVSDGDCSKLTDPQRLEYYHARCEAAGLDPRTQPFQFITVRGGKKVLYARKEATEQLTARDGIEFSIISQVTEGGIRTVTIQAKARDGRQTVEIG